MLNVGRQSFVLVVLEAFQYFCVYDLVPPLPGRGRVVGAGAGGRGLPTAARAASPGWAQRASSVSVQFGRAGRSFSSAGFLSSPLRSMVYRGYFCEIIQSCPSPCFQIGAGRTVYFKEILILVSPDLKNMWWFFSSLS